MAESNEREEKENELYDRQVRLWGFEAQRKMQQSKVLFYGINGLQIETAKNLVLAGINITIVDSNELEESDLSSIYFAGYEDIGKKKVLVVQPKLQALNLFTNVESDLTPLSELSDSYFQQFSCIVISTFSEVEALRVNRICRQFNIPFILSNCYGCEGFFALDFGSSFTFHHDPPRQSQIDTYYYPSLEEIFQTKWSTLERKHSPISKTYLYSRIISSYYTQNGKLPLRTNLDEVQTFCSNLLIQNNLPENYLTIDEIRQNICLLSWSQFIALCSVVGGFLSQEVMKAISNTGVPMMNIFVFSLLDGVGREFTTKSTASNIPLSLSLSSPSSSTTTTITTTTHPNSQIQQNNKIELNLVEEIVLD